MMIKPFTGSYHLNDVEFLLTPLDIPNTSISEKEKLIQSGKQHYSQLLTHESLPTNEYIDLFYKAMQLNGQLVAAHLLNLARQINTAKPNELTLVSLARAGTPIGVLLKHILNIYFKREVKHYSISILRDVGLDNNALRYITQKHAPNSLIFVDGWTAKGVIAKQLESSLKSFEKSDNIIIKPQLAVLSDLCGVAQFSASYQDYLIPSSLLNATVSGLISRTVYNDALNQTTDFHACVYYSQFEKQDLSRYFIDTVLTQVAQIFDKCDVSIIQKPAIDHSKAQEFLIKLATDYHISHANYIKPGIGEATRVLLRREARCLILREADVQSTEHLRFLAKDKAIPIVILPDCPYQAVALIQEICL